MKAVLVGIDRYEHPEVPPLSGCVNDVVLVRGLLKGFFGVPNEDIRVVLNGRATKAAILHRLETMVRESEPGDVLVFYFSGHGSQVRDRDGDELTDQLDELICPYDMDWDRKTFILDDDLDAVFDELPPGVLLEAFFDCCFWGASGTRFEAQPAPFSLRPDVRFLPPPIDIASRFEGEDQWLPVHRLYGCSCFHGRNVLWAATEEGQTAVEDFLDGQVHGVFTYFGCRFIGENIERISRWGYSREELLADVRAYLRAHGYVQVPELSAPDELRAGMPLLPGAWVERGSPWGY